MRKTQQVCVTGFIILIAALLFSCKSTQKTTKVIKPRYHKTYATNRYRVDIPVGARHIRFLGRKKIKTVNMQ